MTREQTIEYAINAEKSFHELSLSEYRNFSPLFAKDVYNITLESSITSRDIPGGTAPSQVEVALKKAREILRYAQNDIPCHSE